MPDPGKAGPAARQDAVGLIPLPAGAPLSAVQADRLAALLDGLDQPALWWLSGYLAGQAGRMPAAAPTPTPDPAPPLLILYGTATGNAEALARRAAAQAAAAGLAAQTADMADFPAADLVGVRHLLVVVSTHGEGEPPDSARTFCETLGSRRAPPLPHLAYAVLGLGDSSYARFCQTGRFVDARLAELGGRRLQARADCDVDYEAMAAGWLETALAAFRQDSAPAAVTPLPAAPAPAASAVDRQHPLPARVLDNLLLSGRGADREVRHIELAVDESALHWAPGDALGVWPENPPGLIEEILDCLGLSGDTPVAGQAGEGSLRDALRRHYDIATLTPAGVERYAGLAGAGALQEAVEAGRVRELMAGRQLIDLLLDYPVRALSAADFVGLLRPLQPRLYSLASSRLALPGEAHLLVGVVRYAQRGRPRAGIASGHFADRCPVDSSLPVFVSPNRHFHLPDDPAAPLVMIGPGTGVAPFRAFLQERVARGAGGRSWLFFGARRRRTDFHYQSEWLRLLRDGRLSRLDVAFSRDQAERIHVRQRLLEHAGTLYGWLEEGAHVYVCGDATHMAPGVHAALQQVIERGGGQSPAAAADYLAELQRAGRYRRDVY